MTLLPILNPALAKNKLKSILKKLYEVYSIVKDQYYVGTNPQQ